jgi:ribosomal protein S18 acetylase RimI-like enzyme
MNNITIIDYRPEHQPFFEKFNRAWIEEHFAMEAVDIAVLEDPEKYILADGGAILMALCDGEVAGTVGLRKLNGNTFEFTKMAVDPVFHRRGIAEQLCYASFKKAKELNAEHVILYSNTKQAAAIRLYERLGFEHLPVENDVYKRANVKMRIDLEKAIQLSSNKLSTH